MEEELAQEAAQRYISGVGGDTVRYPTKGESKSFVTAVGKFIREDIAGSAVSRFLGLETPPTTPALRLARRNEAFTVPYSQAIIRYSALTTRALQLFPTFPARPPRSWAKTRYYGKRTRYVPSKAAYSNAVLSSKRERQGGNRSKSRAKPKQRKSTR